MVLAIIALLFSLLTLLIGYLVAYQHMVGIIADYDSQQIVDKDGLAKWVGSNLIMLGVAGLLIGVVGLFTPGTNKLLVLAFVVILITITGRTSLGCKKFEG